MLAELRGTTREFVAKQCEPVALVYLEKTAVRAERLVLRHKEVERGFISPLDRDNAIAAWHAGMLCDAITRFGLDYEGVGELVTRDVSALVSEISPDTRLPRLHREVDFITRIGQASDMAKAVIHAQVEETLAAMVGRCRRTKRVSLKAELRVKVQRLGELHGAVWTFGEPYEMQGVYSKTKALIAELMQQLGTTR